MPKVVVETVFHGVLMFKRWFLIRHRELAVVLVAVGEGEVYDVIARLRDVDDQAVGRRRCFVAEKQTVGSGNHHCHLADVLREGNGQRVAVNGSMDGRTPWGVLYCRLLNLNMAMAIRRTGARSTAPCRWQQKAEQQND